MACKGCGKGGGNRHNQPSGGADLSKFAYLKPNQLEILKRQLEEKQEADKNKK